MTAELIMPTLPGTGNGQQAPQQHRPFQPTQRPQHFRSISYQVPASQHQVSPLSSSDEAQQRSSEPSSPKQRYTPQDRPLYMPAVLRPNSDFTQGINRSNTAGQCSSCSKPSSRRNSNSSTFMSVPGLGVIQRLSRRSTGDSDNDKDKDKSIRGSWDLDLFPTVTDLPTKKHWKPDPESSICDDLKCKRAFSYFVRRHHCRRCGNIFCDQHSSYEIPLDQDANYNPRAAPSRTCGHCFDEFKAWHTRNNSQTSSSASSDVQHSTPPTPVAAPPKPALTLAKSPDAAASVPRDWNWSTF